MAKTTSKNPRKVTTKASSKKATNSTVVGSVKTMSTAKVAAVSLIAALVLVFLGTFVYGKVKANSIKAQAARWTTLGVVDPVPYGSYGSVSLSQAGVFYGCKVANGSSATKVKLIIDNKTPSSRYFWYSRTVNNKVTSTSNPVNSWWGGSVYAAEFTVNTAAKENVLLFIGAARGKSPKQPSGYSGYVPNVGFDLSKISAC